MDFVLPFGNGLIIRETLQNTKRLIEKMGAKI
jgi:hypothetical protein